MPFIKHIVVMKSNDDVEKRTIGLHIYFPIQRHVIKRKMRMRNEGGFFFSIFFLRTSAELI